MMMHMQKRRSSPSSSFALAWWCLYLLALVVPWENGDCFRPPLMPTPTPRPPPSPPHHHHRRRGSVRAAAPRGRDDGGGTKNILRGDDAEDPLLFSPPPLDEAAAGAAAERDEQQQQGRRRGEGGAGGGIAIVPPSRRAFFASGLFGAGACLVVGCGGRPEVAGDFAAPAGGRGGADDDDGDVRFLWQKNPVNPKRSGFRITDAERRGYNVSFVTYLSRFLLSFDPSAQRWWTDRAKEIPKSASREEVFAIREGQFARFSASVEVGLQEDDFVGRDGPKRLLRSLLAQFGPSSGGPPSSSSSSDDNSTREEKEARRQIALLFGLLEDSQPTKEITALLASIDDGAIGTVNLDDDARSAGLLGGFSPDDAPVVEFPDPQAGSGYRRALGRAVLRPTGKLLRIEIVDGGEGYTEIPDVSEALANLAAVGGGGGGGGAAAIADAKIANGTLKAVKLLDGGSGYGNEKAVEARLRPPSGTGRPAIIRIVPEMEIAKIEVDDAGSGYAVEKPVKVKLVVPTSRGDPQPIGEALPEGKMGSFIAARNPYENKIRNFERALLDGGGGGIKGKAILSGAASGGNLPPSPFPEKASSSQQLLALLPRGFGLEYDAQKRIYVLSVDEEYQALDPALNLRAPNRPLVPDFGPRGRSPIERDRNIDLPTLLRFSASGAICASAVHLATTPLDVVKTKVQIDPGRYPRILPSFRSVWEDGGPSAFFTGWLPTVAGHFASGGVLYAATEVIRRSLTEAAGADAAALEVPIILASAGAAAAVGATIYCPFDAVRIRSVARPPGYEDGAGGAIGTARRMVEEEGFGVLTDAIPVFVAKQVPYAAVKFTIFDLTTENLYRTFPLAQEDLKLSLGISLFCGVLAGIAAAAVSNPADAVISELKKAKSDRSPREALRALLDRGGVPALFKGLPIRMVLYSLNASFQFFIYDGVRFALGVGPDDLRLYLDVLGEALTKDAA